MDPLVRNFVLGVSLAAPLGPAGVAVIQNGLRSGFTVGFLTGLGVTLADTAYLLLVFFGLAPFVELPGVRLGVWFLGALALGYLGVRSLQEGFGQPRIATDGPVTARHPALVGFVVNASNPLAIVWWLGVFGGLLAGASQGQTRLQALLASGAILAGILCWHTSIAMLTHWGGRLINVRLVRWVSVLAGVLLLVFGVAFAASAVRAILAS